MHRSTPRRLRAGLTALAAIAAVATTALLPAGAHAAAAAGTASKSGACTGTEGVTVVVDFAPDSLNAVRCVLGTPSSGLDALERGGFDVEMASTNFGPVVCQIDNAPIQGYPDCFNRGYWSYWQGTPAGTWDFAPTGASDTTPQPGGIEGWRYVADFRNDQSEAPRVGPAAPAVVVDAPATVRTGTAAQLEVLVPFASAALTCSIDGAAFAPCGTAGSAGRRVVALPTSALGEHMVRLDVTGPGGSVTRIDRRYVVTPVPATLTDAVVSGVAAGSATAVVTVRSGDAAQSVHVEYTADADRAAAVRTAPVRVPVGGTPTRVQVRITGLAPGTRYEWRLVTTGDGGSAETPWATFTTRRNATKLRLGTGADVVLRGRRVRVQAEGLGAGERYTVRLGATVVASGVASGSGTVARFVLVPARTAAGARTLLVRGSQLDRNARTTLHVVRPARLVLSAPARPVATGSLQRVSVAGLAPGEPVRITVDRRVVTPADATASADGEYVLQLPVGARAGVRVVRAYGVVGTRTATRTIRVALLSRTGR